MTLYRGASTRRLRQGLGITNAEGRNEMNLGSDFLILRISTQHCHIPTSAVCLASRHYSDSARAFGIDHGLGLALLKHTIMNATHCERRGSRRAWWWAPALRITRCAFFNSVD